MGDLIILFIGVVLLLGPGVVLYGAAIIIRRRAHLYPGKVLVGGKAVIAGIVTMVAGLGFLRFLWKMGQYLPH